MKILNWYALYTKSRHEKSVYEELCKRRIESFLPTRVVKRRWSDRTKVIEEPLFKSYLFVKTDPLHKTDVLTIKGSVKFVSAGKRPIFVEERLIICLKNLIERQINIDPFPYFSKGDRIFVKSGPFRGTEGYIIRKDSKKCRLVISIEAIASSVSIELDSYLVEKI